jgi:hypothetical protein
MNSPDDAPMEELLNNFSALLDNYARHREYINRARAQAEKFSSEIIKKVVLDHEIKASSLSDEILPLIPEIEGHISRVDGEKDDILGSKSTSDEAMQELELRHLIGEITDDEFASLTSDLRTTLDDANGRLEALDSERGTLSEALGRWTELAAESGHDAGLSSEDEVDEMDLVAEEAPAEAEVSAEVSAEDEAEAEAEAEDEDEIDVGDVLEESVEDDHGDASFDPIAAEPDGHHASFGGTEDLSVVLADADDDEPVIATMEVEDDVDEFPLDDEPEDVMLDSMEEDDGVHSIDDVAGIIVDFDNVEVEPALPAGADEPRRALLLYQEGTAEEQIYPFTGDVLTIGRGRDNDIQIKNDSKVSRFHCKLFRRSANFYIEDNKSSNGTLVNGELITERRLFGGEEVIIGETFFRFRIM